MSKEYLFYYQGELDFPLHESIEVLTKADSGDYLVANVATPNTQVYAPEINFYLENSLDDISDKITNIKKLYDIRSSIYDLAQDLDFEQNVGEKLLIVTNEEFDSNIEKDLKDFGFACISIPTDIVVDVEGHIGELKVTIRKETEFLDIETDQIIWFDAPAFAMKQSGTVDPNLLGLEKAIEKVKANLGTYKYKNFIKYDPTICQYHERMNKETCGKCAEVCPTVAIMKIDEERHLEFSHVDCHGCGGCISVCPSGSLEYAQMPRVAFSEITPFFKGQTALIVPRKMEIENLHVKLEKGILPLAIEGEKFLHEAHLMNLLQTSGRAVIFYTDFVSKGTSDVIRIINDIFEKKYNKKAIYVCENESELEKAFKDMENLDECVYGFNEDGMRKREVFSARLAHLVGEDDLGVVKTGEHVHYGNIKINQDNCTVCLSCVGACNVRALTAHPEDNTLRFNPSICTNCGFCEAVCPEKDCLSVIRDEISLAPDYFKQNVMAHDDLFKCVECGQEFATVKSVEKIANTMKPLFGNDELRIKSLYCCATCKPKIMLKAHLDKRFEAEGKL